MTLDNHLSDTKVDRDRFGMSYVGKAVGLRRKACDDSLETYPTLNPLRLILRKKSLLLLIIIKPFDS